MLLYSCYFVSSAVGKTTFCREIVGAYSTQRGPSATAEQVCDASPAAPFIRPDLVVKVSEDCVVNLFESVGYGDEYDYQQQIQLIKSYLLKTHMTYNDLEWNKMTEQVCATVTWIINHIMHCHTHTHTASHQELKSDDKRIHCVFYLIPSHSLKAMDLLFLEQISSLAAVVLVVTKADCMMTSERAAYLGNLKAAVDRLSDSIRRPVLFDFHETGTGDFESPSESTFPKCVSPRGCDQSTVSSSTISSDCIEDTCGQQSSYVDVSSDPLLLEELSAGSSPAVGSSVDKGDEELLYGLEHSLLMSECSRAGQQGMPLLPKVPNIFAVICGSDGGLPMESGSSCSRRVYPWGSVSSLDERLSDFRRLQRLVFESGTAMRFIQWSERISIALATQKEEVQRAKVPDTDTHCGGLLSRPPSLKSSQELLLHAVSEVLY